MNSISILGRIRGGGGSHGLVALSRVRESNQVGFALLHRVCGGEKMV